MWKSLIAGALGMVVAAIVARGARTQVPAPAQAASAPAAATRPAFATTRTAPRPAFAMYPPPRENGRALRELFEHPEQWGRTRSLIQALGYADHNLNRQFTDDQLRPWFALLGQWGLKLELEVGAIKPWAVTGQKIFDVQRAHWDRFSRLGATISAIAMDEPLCCVRKEIARDDEYAVRETAAFIALVRKHYPHIRIGDIEAYPFIPLADQVRWIDALQKRLAEKGVAGLDFFRLDVDWVSFTVGRPGSWPEVKKIEQHCRRLKIPFSLIYWASGYPALQRRGLADDSTWYVSMMQQGYDYAVVEGRPDQYVIESWIDAPAACVPETGEFTFTRSVLDFVRKFGFTSPAAAGPSSTRPAGRP